MYRGAENAMMDQLRRMLEDKGLEAESWDEYGTPSVQVIGKERSLITSYEKGDYDSRWVGVDEERWTWQLAQMGGCGKRGTYVYGEYEPSSINDEEGKLKDMADQIEEVWKFIGEGK